MNKYRGRILLLAASVFFLSISTVIWIVQEVNQPPKRQTPSTDETGYQIAQPQKTQTPTVTHAQSLSPAEPETLRIPRLGIEAAVQGVGLNSKGEMKAPSSRLGLTWYKHGYLPGAPGNAVIAGHNEYKRTEGIFSKLNQLSQGDIIEVVNRDFVQTFVIQSLQTYDAETLAAAVFGPDEQAKLNLITCDGVWNAQKKSYSSRLVVTAIFSKEVSRHF